MRTMTRKGYGRIYCFTADDVPAVNAVIKEMDAFEYDYLPKGMVAPFSEYPNVIYTHKFDGLDLDDLTVVCWKRGLLIWAFDAGGNEFPVSAGERVAE